MEVRKNRMWWKIWQNYFVTIKPYSAKLGYKSTTFLRIHTFRDQLTNINI